MGYPELVPIMKEWDMLEQTLTVEELQILYDILMKVRHNKHLEIDFLNMVYGSIAVRLGIFS